MGLVMSLAKPHSAKHAVTRMKGSAMPAGTRAARSAARFGAGAVSSVIGPQDSLRVVTPFLSRRLPYLRVSPVITTAKALAGPVVEGEAVDACRGLRPGRVTVDHREVLLLDGRVEGVTGDRLHHHQRVGVGVEVDERQDPVEQRGDRQPVGPEHAAVHRVPGEVGVGQHDLVAVPHLGEDLQQVGADARVDAFQHGVSLRPSRDRRHSVSLRREHQAGEAASSSSSKHTATLPHRPEAMRA